MSRANDERRRDTRHAPDAEHLSWWERPERRDPHIAEILDSSRSGVGLLVSRTACPRHGEAIRLTHGPTSNSRCARVVRVSPLEDGHVRLGCRWITAHDEARAAPARPRRAASPRRARRAA